jgi:putative FmdB family regulatory protein
MPIYEFKCTACQECFELLMLNSDEKLEMKCPKCSARNLERVLSTTNFQISAQSGPAPASTSTTRTCAAGNCTTWEAPGPVK